MQTNQLMLFKEIIIVYSENQSILKLKQLVHIVTTMVNCVYILFSVCYSSVNERYSSLIEIKLVPPLACNRRSKYVLFTS